jgi:uncharacterized membrane protein
MRTFLLVYTIAYAVLGAVAIAVYVMLVPRQEKTNGHAGETVLDAILLLIGLAGMILLIRDFSAPLVKNSWKLVSVALLVTQFWLNLRARARHLAAKPADERSLLVRAGDFGLFALLAPSLAFNLAYAFGDYASGRRPTQRLHRTRTAAFPVLRDL